MTDEKYEVTIASTYDESGLKILSPKSPNHDEYVRLKPFWKKKKFFSFHLRFELDEEMYIACAILNESLYDTHADKRKVVSINE